MPAHLVHPITIDRRFTITGNDLVVEASSLDIRVYPKTMRLRSPKTGDTITFFRRDHMSNSEACIYTGVSKKSRTISLHLLKD